MRAGWFAACVCAATALLAAGRAAAFPEGTFGLQLENDVVASDRHYTHGTRLFWVSEDAEGGPQFVRRALEWLWLPGGFETSSVGLQLGQNIYTPEEKKAVAVIPDDRPYAGWLYIGGAIHQEDKAPEGFNGIGMFDVLTSFELDLGVVGPWALAEETQDLVHQLGPNTDVVGWDNQLDNEPAIVAFVERKWRTPALKVGAAEFDAVPRIGGALGNVYTYANAGLTWRVGQGLDVDYGVPFIRPGVNGSDAIAPDTDFAWYVYGGLDGRAVARNIFLDGNTFNSSHSVNKKPFVGDVAGGAVVVWRDIRLSGSGLWRTKEFQKQKQTNVFGALTVSYAW